MKVSKIAEPPNKARSNILLFVFSFIFIFLVPLFPIHWHVVANNILFSILFFLGVYALESVKKVIIPIAIFAFVSQWIAMLLGLRLLQLISDITNLLFFQFIIIQLVIQIAKSKKVDTDVIFESINAYLLMGVFFSAWVAILMYFIPDSFNGIDPEQVSFQDLIYFTFVTMTTLGYGEITPNIPIAKSLAILISTSGQLYIAIIIAMLVGKFAGNQESKE